MKKDLIKEYKKVETALFEHVGFVPDWVTYPIEDRTDYVWAIVEETEVHFAESVEDFDTGESYAEEIYTQRFYDKWVYRGKKYTMIITDSGTDGMKYFAFFDNGKEQKW